MTNYRVIHANPRSFIIRTEKPNFNETSSSIVLPVTRVTSTGATRVTSTGATRIINRASTVYPVLITANKRSFTILGSKVETQ